MTCPNCHCRECIAEKVNGRLREFLAERVSYETGQTRIEADRQWDADEARKELAKSA